MSRYKFGKLMLNNNNKKKNICCFVIEIYLWFIFSFRFFNFTIHLKKKKKLIYPNFSTKLNFLPQVVVHCDGRKKNNLKKKRYRT